MSPQPFEARVCVCVAEPTATRCLQVRQRAHFAEVRLDALHSLELPGELLRSIFDPSRPTIATFRSTARFSDTQRQELLLRAIDAGAWYVDLDVHHDTSIRTAIVAAAKAKNCRVIVSLHNYHHTPELNELRQAVQQCFDAGADVAKLACMVQRRADSIRLLSLLVDPRPLVVIGMGARGQVTRLVAPLLGSPFTYAFGDSGPTAPGQLAAADLQQAYDLLGTRMGLLAVHEDEHGPG